MDFESFGERLTTLRIAKGISARDMSLSLGQSANYINKIENKKTYPSMRAFFYICEYLGVSQLEFFDEDNQNPEQLKELIANLKKLDEKTLSHLSGIVERMLGRK